MVADWFRRQIAGDPGQRQAGQAQGNWFGAGWSV